MDRKARLADMTMLKPDEAAFIEERCGVSYAAARRAFGEGQPVPFWSFFVSDEPLTGEDIRAAHEMISEYEASEGRDLPS
jgi:hypothetical protein